MTKTEVEAWIRINGTGVQDRRSVNGIDYLLATMADGWIAIFEYNKFSGGYDPRIQASDMDHALGYISMIEPLTVPVIRL